MSASNLHAVSKPDTNEENSNENVKDDQECETEAGLSSVTTHLYIKPAHSSGSLDKEVVLRQIRQRRRAYKMGSALQGLFKADDKRVSVKWIDDPFAAP